MLLTLKINNLFNLGVSDLRTDVHKGELLFFDIMLAWARILQQKYLLGPPALLGCGLNEVANIGEFRNVFAAPTDFYVEGASVWLDYAELPFQDEAFTQIVTTQILEPTVALSTLSETCRVLDYGGYLIVFYFSACSLLLPQKLFKCNAFELPALHTALSIKRVLNAAGLKVVEERAVAYRPLVPEDKFEELLYLEVLGLTLFPFLSSCSYIVAKKDTEAFNLSAGEYCA